ncbi:hypothetical protein [Bradyrhizobium jicamae]|uniref:hypothetical protein n=1 Tax=Bradyrhizobium jicamae TaxID=280332 RepID=UPI001BADE19D|nr:hypothetical protein [Bradyrhizobium jicamae]MBR0936988.1 hypothetical protein [Bradyrhizobium jicamae]
MTEQVETISLNIEPTQEYFRDVMRDLGFTEEQIEENRQHNGRLFLTPAVVFGMLRGFQAGSVIDTVTGDLKTPKQRLYRPA